MARLLEVCSIILFFISFLPYAVEIVKDRIKPVTATWAVWALLDLITLFALWQAGSVTPLAILALTASGGVVILSLRYGERGWSYMDAGCFMLSILAVVAWKLTQDPFYGLCISQAAVFIAAIPTFVSVYRDPANESLLAWGINLLSGTSLIIALFLRDARGIEVWLQPYVFWIIQGTIVVLVLRNPQKT